MTQKNFEEIIETCHDALEYFETKGLSTNTSKFVYQNKLIIAYLQTGKLENVEPLLKSNIEITTPGSINWFLSYDYYFLLCSLSKRYQDAYEILAIVFSHPKFKNSLESQKQLWFVKEAYIHFLIGLGKIDPTLSSQKVIRPFRLQRFLNAVPMYSKDKRGINISILIIQMLLLIQNKKYNEIIDRTDSLNQYCYRYLRNDETFRSNCFMKMLLKLPDADYHPIRVKRYTDKLLVKLKNNPFKVSEKSTEIEIVPYENLWDLVLELLEKS